MIAIGSDHGGFDLKELVIRHLKEKGMEVKDLGCYDKSSCDYPTYGKAVANAVADGSCEKGIVICTTGIGISITANKVKGIRAALCADTLSAKLTRLHNDANVLAMGAGIVGPNLALEIVDTFLNTEFSGEERHQRRIDAIES
ncbi:MAG: ribose 5-phosphate isomerase B [Lachnospiraceae bacterium]|nr:ribose 5-phosphate isomerase B [Lachnospiraceae bacterium]MDD5853411.1 ribose 5-phosphate isomerase B [Lachnospiraceae bacterium]